MIALAKARGTPGEKGLDGMRGADGINGINGKDGIDGMRGADGRHGAKGLDGLKGEIGAVGPQGEKGEAGMIWRGTYRNDIEYDIGDVVGVSGSAYVCTAATNQAPPVGFGWELLVSRGAQGVRGIKGEAGSGAAIDLPVSIANGGTGQTTAKNALDALLPSQTGKSGRFLQTNGVSPLWEAVLADASTLEGTTLKSTVVNSSLTSVGTLASLTVTAPIGGSITGNAATATTADTVTNPNLTGEVTTSGLTATVANSAVIGKVLTGYVSGAGTVAATDTILQAIQKLNGNAGGGAAAAGTLTGTTLASNVVSSSLTSVGTLTGLTVSATITGSVSGNAATVTTNANLTGHITSTGNAAVLGSFTSAQLRTALTDETGTGAAVFAATPTFATSVVGSASMDVFNTTSTTVNGFGAATAMTLGATTGSAAIRNPTLTVGNTTSTIATASGTANTLTLQPFGSLVLSPTSSSVVGGDRTSLTITNSDNAVGTVSISGGNLYLGKKTDSSPITTAANIVFEGLSDDANETTLTVTDPTLDRTITLPDATGTVALTANKLSAFAATTSSELAGVISDDTGTGALVFATSPVLVTPNLGTPSTLVGTNISGTGASFTAGTVTNPNLTGEVTTSGLTATVTNSAVIGKVLTGYVSGAGTVAATDTILQAIQKLNGNAGGGAAAAGTLTGTTLASNVVTSSLTTVGTLTNLTVTNTIVGSVNGNAATATSATSATTAGTVTTAAQPTITSVGTLTSLTTSGVITGTNATASTSSTTGAVILSGGVGIAKDSHINSQRIGVGLLANTTNLAVGANALAATITGGINNTAIGSGCGSGITSGSQNTLLGYAVGTLVTTGAGNCSIGYASLNQNTVGNYNTAMGYGALEDTTGSNNTAVGIAALGNNTTGALNTAVGREAGCFQADGTTALTTANNSVYLGRDTRGTQSDSNSVVIGYQAIGLGANTTVIGTSSTTSAKVWGAVTAAGTLTADAYILSSSGIQAKTASYTLVAADNGKVITMSVATANTLTVPASLAVGFNCTIIQIGAGQTTITASGTTLNSVSAFLKISAQHGSASIISYASNVYNVAGSLSA